MPDDEQSATLTAHPVISYATAVTAGSACVLELTVAQPSQASGGPSRAVFRFALRLQDAARLGQALSTSADLARALLAVGSTKAPRH